MVQTLYSSGRTLKHGIRNGPPAVQIKFQNSLFSSNVFFRVDLEIYNKKSSALYFLDLP